MTLTVQPNRQPVAVGKGVTIRGNVAYEVFQ